MNKLFDYFSKTESLTTKSKILIILYAVLFLSVVYHFVYARKIIPGVKVGSVNLGGLTYDQAKVKLEEYEKFVTKKLVLKYENRELEIDGDSIKLAYIWDASLTRAYEVGRTGNVLVDTKDKIAGLLKVLYLAAFYDFDEDLFHAKFSQLKGEINKENMDASFKINENGKLELVEGTTGYKISDDDLFKIIIAAFDRIDFESRNLPIEVLEQKIFAKDIEPLKPQAEKIIFNQITIVNGTKKWVLSKEQLAGLLAFEKENDKTEIVLNEPKFNGFLETINQEANQPPRGKVTQLEGDKVVRFEIIDTGKEVDSRAFTKLFKETYLNAGKTVELVLKPSEPKKDLSSYGIFSLLGEGNSKFVGSSRARIHNLSLAAEKTNGVLVPPNGVYSLNNAVGEISAKTGFDAALIIRGGRTVLGEGGGVCQTSTTLFRAVLDAGLPVMLRYQHAYRVYYYEQDSKPGFDAAIFQPTLDFQFKNDTPNYVLVETSVDPDNLALQFRIYGTPDGRTVEVTEPVITAQTAPPEPQYIDDPTLEKGKTVQVEHSAWGASVSFMRTVRRAGEILHAETFKSRYQPWRAVFRVGTKE